VQVKVVNSLSELPPVADSLLVGPALISFDTESGVLDATLSVDNENEESAIDWQVSASEPWISFGATSGVTPAEVMVSFTNTGLDVGRHVAEITVASTATPGENRTVQVEVNVTSSCVGDCDGNRNVAINELIRGVNIALELAPLTACPVFDADDNGRVSISELIVAVNNALDGC
jgi:hypothetical protein